MRRIAAIVLIVGLVLTFGVAAYANDVKCPIDGSSAWATGKTRTDVSGATLWLYKCGGFGHEFWVAQ
jgi:hypothetical protein